MISNKSLVQAHPYKDAAGVVLFYYTFYFFNKSVYAISLLYQRFRVYAQSRSFLSSFNRFKTVFDKAAALFDFIFFYTRAGA